ncbi:HAMP domain-containing protein [Virgibacillus dakarensis]|uniref:histidine kinase n=1 Tax=Virgibacillus halodenitrificans TaxID=1482 RepID=A0AAC9NLI5_VIRHA|nr:MULTISPECIES: ATP-binding protein [Virgibacillus]APC49043.1 two-component sensor histidine kinase [Virgibacillus halodenitrificans]MBT2218354.1 GHKL domain-containing protein [Virgibacillus dakarensis]MTW84778.1 HAMP domain-containing protein [Virgibacillus dakarensis]
MFNKLSLKIGLLFFVFMLIIEVFVYFILYTNIANERIDEVMDSLLARANTHSAVLENNFDSSTLEHVAIMESESEFAVIITDANGNIIINSDPVEKEMFEVIVHTDYKDIPSVGKVVEQRWSEKQYIAVDSPITIDEEHQGHVFMFANTNIVKNMVNHLSDQFVIVGLITIVLTIFTVFILSRFITLPLMKMKEATEQLSKGKNKVELHKERKDELGELAGSIMRLSSDLERLKNDRNEFLASISHELRTPLTYIKGYADIINKQDITDEERKEYLDIIREETEHLTVLVKNLFDLARMDENRFVINRKNVNFRQLIQTIEERISPVLEEKNITLFASCPVDIIGNIDPDRIQQVLLNILDNARKHTPEGKSISLEVTQYDREITITISDEGEGIPKEELPYLFERLYRVEKSRSRESGGTGLGLAIAKEIIESHGGTIEIESELGKGTRVIVHLTRGEYNG